MAEIENSVNRLLLDGVEIKTMTGWGQSMVNDYLGIQESLRILARELDALTNFITPSSIVVNSAGAVTGTVADVQDHHDGNVLTLAEVTGTPPSGAFDIDFIFEGVETFNGVVTYLDYSGSAVHTVTQRLHNFDTGLDEQYILIPTSTQFQYRTILIPDDGRYIDEANNNQVRLSIVHESNGNNAHSIAFDYMALIGLEA